jgi:RNA polymerase sigma-70 factor (ECF subfamily)
MPFHSLGDGILGLAQPDRAVTALQDQVAQLFEEAREDVYRYLLMLGVHPPQAQEAAQEAFLRLYASMKKGEVIENPRAWVFRVAHNLGLRIRQKQSSQQPFDPEIESQMAAPGQNAEERLLERERTLRFHRAVEGLSEQQRRCLYLRLEGLRYPQIGSILGISASTVGEFLRRAMTRLKKIAVEER